MADFSFSAKIRLHQKNKLIIKQNILIETKQSHYLLNVMRKKINDKILIFNQFDGEFLAEIILIKKKIITLFKDLEFTLQLKSMSKENNIICLTYIISNNNNDQASDQIISEIKKINIKQLKINLTKGVPVTL